MSPDESELAVHADCEFSVFHLHNTLSSQHSVELADGARAAIANVLEPPSRTPFAGTCNEPLRAGVEAYVQAGIAPATKRAYRADLDHFEAWGGTIPATVAQVAAYLADHATVLKVSTLTRRLAAVSIAHDARDLPNPVRTPLVQATMRGIRREHGAAQRQARPLLREDLFVVLAAMDDRLKDLRDRALLLIGFAGGLRRSELAAIDLNDFERVREGIILTIRRSKTDQDGEGARSASPSAEPFTAPSLRWKTGSASRGSRTVPFSGLSIDTAASRPVASLAKPCP
jgi:integrase